MSESYDPISDLFATLIAADTAVRAEEKRLREERRNTPEAKARRRAAARQGWETRRAREAAEDAADRARQVDELERIPTGPVCGELYHNGIGQKRTCTLEPGHAEEFCGED